MLQTAVTAQGVFQPWTRSSGSVRFVLDLERKHVLFRLISTAAIAKRVFRGVLEGRVGWGSSPRLRHLTRLGGRQGVCRLGTGRGSESVALKKKRNDTAELLFSSLSSRFIFVLF